MSGNFSHSSHGYVQSNDLSGFVFDPPLDPFLILQQYDFDLLPDFPALNELREHDQWVSWHYVVREGSAKPTKPPLNARTGGGASHSNPSTWSTFAQAVEHTYKRNLPGVGYVITEEDGYTGYDLDKCVDAETGEIEPWAQAVIDLAETYAEISPSGTGLRLIARGKIEKTIKVDAAGVEAYRAQRYLTITGKHVPSTPTAIQPAPRTHEALLARVATFDTAKAEALKPAQPLAPVELKAPRIVEATAASAPKKGDFFRNVNNEALANLGAWVPALFPAAKRSGDGTWRITSATLGRDLQEDLSLASTGIVDYGVHDMGDPTEGRRTAVDIVIQYSSLQWPKEAALWLCERMCRAPELLGFGADDTNLVELGNAIVARLDRGSEPANPAWGKPDLTLLSNGRRPAPLFDTNWLGPDLAPWVTVQAGEASAPTDYVAVSLLALAGAVIGNLRRPNAGASWSEASVLWCALVGSPSSGKSPAMSSVTILLDEAERLMAADHERRTGEYEAAKIVSQGARETWENNVRLCANEGGPLPEKPADAKEPTQPVFPRIKVGDATTEKLGLMAAANPNALLLARDELSGWYASFGRYGGSGSDRAFALEMYGGREYFIDRVKHPIPIRVRHLSVGVLGGIQPDKVADILESDDDGLVARMLWCFPEPLADFRIPREKSRTTMARSAMTRLSQLPAGIDEAGEQAPVPIEVDSDAVDQLETFGREINVRVHLAAGQMGGVLGKARGHALRLSCVLEHLWWAASGQADGVPTTISKRAVVAACAMMEEYFLPMAERVLGDASIPTAERNAMALARCLRQLRRTHFNARELRREIGGTLREASAMDAACGVLEEAGLVRACHVRQGGTKGRTSKAYDVNPAVVGAL